MRKLLLSLATILFMTGLVIAAEVTVVKYDKDKKEVTVKDDKDKENTYKISEKVKVTTTDKDGNAKDGKAEDLYRRLEGGKGGKGGKGGTKLDITVENDEITAVKMRGRGGKN